MKRFLFPAAIAVAVIFASPSLSAQQTQPVSVDSTEALPDPNEFVMVEQDPQFDMQDLSSRVRYPEEARKNNIQGQVVIRVFVDKTGRVRKTRIDHSDNPLLEEAALNAVRDLLFTPAIQNGKPVGVWVSIPINFSLR